MRNDIAAGSPNCSTKVAPYVTATSCSAWSTDEDPLKTVTRRAPAPRWRRNPPVGYIRPSEPGLIDPARPPDPTGCTRSNTRIAARHSRILNFHALTQQRGPRQGGGQGRRHRPGLEQVRSRTRNDRPSAHVARGMAGGLPPRLEDILHRGRHQDGDPPRGRRRPEARHGRLFLDLVLGELPLLQYLSARDGHLPQRYRRDRRPGLPRENPLLFYARHRGGQVVTYGNILAMFARIYLWKRRLERDPKAKAYTDEALRTDDYDHQEMYQLSEAARQAAEGQAAGGAQPRSRRACGGGEVGGRLSLSQRYSAAAE